NNLILPQEFNQEYNKKEKERKDFSELLKNHFENFGWPKEEEFVKGKDYLLNKNIQTGIDNWLIEVIEPLNEYFDKLFKLINPNFGQKLNETKQKTIELLNKYSR
ncbi:hypothetical protein Mgra_00008135, partial [Meloidogyne graminicola]